MDDTCAVYVVSDDWQFQAYVAIHSLLSSGSAVDRVVVLMVGGGGGNLRRLDGPIEVREVPNINDDFFLANKTQITSIEADRLVFLDADTVVLRPLETVWENREADIIARPDQAYERADFPDSLWTDARSLVGAPDGPYLNSGFIVFQNGAHQQMGDSWREICRTLREQYEPDEQFAGLTRRFAEQMAFGMSVARNGLSWTRMSADEHAYAWTLPFGKLKTEVHPVVYHACGPFVDQAIRLERKNLLDFSHPNMSSGLHVHFITLQAKRLIRHTKDKVSEIFRKTNGIANSIT